MSTNNVGRTDSHMGVDVTGATRTALEGGPANALTINATNTPNAWALTTAAPWSTMTNDHIVVTDNKGTCAGKPLAHRTPWPHLLVLAGVGRSSEAFARRREHLTGTVRPVNWR